MKIISKEHISILKHTRDHAAGGLYCGDSPAIQELVAEGMMAFAGRKSFVPDPYFKLTAKGREALGIYEAWSVTKNKDITLAEQNYIQLVAGKPRDYRGGFADKLLSSPDFIPARFAYSVWEVLTDCYDWQTDCVKHAAILRANQTTLAGALKFMDSDRRVLVWQSDIPDGDEVSFGDVLVLLKHAGKLPVPV